MSASSDPPCAAALVGEGAARALLVHRHAAVYLPDAPEILLWVAVERDPGGRVRLAAAPAAGGEPPAAEHLDVAAFARRFGAPCIDLGRPLPLAPVAVPKPWGREIWFTGIEARGQAGVLGDGGVLPLPWLLSIAATEVLGAGQRELNLLKILDPLPDPVYGDLYFELHEEKREVYVVTGVDPVSWPDGRGAIRYGFAPEARAAYASDDEFRAAYLASVRDYEQIRRAIEALEAQWRAAEGHAPRAPVAPATLRRWRAALSPGLRREEERRRRTMESFTQLRHIRVGDVVEVPRYLPHALQHGVRTVEFQTPVYERRILSFAQQVLTQDHWDTELAVAKMHVVPPPESPPVAVREQPGVTRERIVAFADFRVDRLALDPGARWSLDLGGAYALIMNIRGRAWVDGVELAEEAAVLAPAACGRVQIGAAAEPALLLISRPN
ncbi:MAG: hypothetical protein ACOY42_01585 [Pseudomonadota bacterium]|jgi:hypothetical protein